MTDLRDLYTPEQLAALLRVKEALDKVSEGEQPVLVEPKE